MLNCQLTQNESVVSESQQVPLLAVERQPFANKLAVIVKDLCPDGGVVALLGDEELSEQIVLQPNHGSDIVPAEGVVQVEADAVVVVEAKGRARVLGHHEAEEEVGGGGGEKEEDRLGLADEERPLIN